MKFSQKLIESFLCICPFRNRHLLKSNVWRAINIHAEFQEGFAFPLQYAIMMHHLDNAESSLLRKVHASLVSIINKIVVFKRSAMIPSLFNQINILRQMGLNFYPKWSQNCEDSMEVESLGHGDGEDDEMGLEKTFSNDSLEMFPSC